MRDEGTDRDACLSVLEDLSREDKDGGEIDISMKWAASQMETEYRHWELVNCIDEDVFDDDAERLEMAQRNTRYENLANGGRRPAEKVVLQPEGLNQWGVSTCWRLAR